MVAIAESRVRIARATLGFSILFAPLDAVAKFFNGDYFNAISVTVVALACAGLLWLSRVPGRQWFPVYSMLGVLIGAFVIGMPRLAQHPEMAVWLPLYPFYFYSLAGQRVGNILVGASLAYLAAINYWNDFSAVVNIPEAAVAYAFSIVLGYVHESVHNSERRKLERIALLDNLTGAYNRHGLSSTWAGIHQHAVLTGSAISLVLFDIDHFKKINDVHGHDVGDRVLKKVVERVKMRLRASDYIVRWGGEEFALILPGADVSQAAKVAENLRKGIEGEPFDSVGTVTCSFGVCRADGDVDFEVAIKRADEALYSAKSLGRNRVETAPEPVNGNPVAVSV